MMTKQLTAEVLANLKTNGFLWAKDGSCDRVAVSDIKDILPAAEGFTVVYTDDPKVVLRMSTCRVESVELAESGQWNRVNWLDITDERKVDANSVMASSAT